MRVSELKNGEVYLEARGRKRHHSSFWRHRKVEVLEAGVEEMYWRKLSEKHATKKEAVATQRRLKKNAQYEKIKHWKITRTVPRALEKTDNKHWYWVEGLVRTGYYAGGRRFSVVRPLTNYQGDKLESAVPELVGNNKIQMPWSEWETANAAEVKRQEEEAEERKRYHQMIKELDERLKKLTGVHTGFHWSGSLNNRQLRVEFTDYNHADEFVQLLEERKAK